MSFVFGLKKISNIEQEALYATVKNLFRIISGGFISEALFLGEKDLWILIIFQEIGMLHSEINKGIVLMVAILHKNLFVFSYFVSFH